MNIPDDIHQAMKAMRKQQTFIDGTDVRRILLRLSYHYGSQKNLAAALGVSAQYVTDILHGKRKPGPAILRVLGIEAQTIYVEVAA